MEFKNQTIFLIDKIYWQIKNKIHVQKTNIWEFHTKWRRLQIRWIIVEFLSIAKYEQSKKKSVAIFVWK